MYLEYLKQAFRTLHVSFAGYNWKEVFFKYAFNEIEILSFIVFLTITIESFLRYRKISRDVLLDNSTNDFKDSIKVLEKRKLFFLLYSSFIIARISYILVRFTFVLIYHQTVFDEFDLYLFHPFLLNHTMPIFLEGVFLALTVIVYGILSYCINSVTYEKMHR
jgi:hypothetical protein